MYFFDGSIQYVRPLSNRHSFSILGKKYSISKMRVKKVAFKDFEISE